LLLAAPAYSQAHAAVPHTNRSNRSLRAAAAATGGVQQARHTAPCSCRLAVDTPGSSRLPLLLAASSALLLLMLRTGWCSCMPAHLLLSTRCLAAGLYVLAVETMLQLMPSQSTALLRALCMSTRWSPRVTTSRGSWSTSSAMVLATAARGTGSAAAVSPIVGTQPAAIPRQRDTQRLDCSNRLACT
jgi:hypothetical protein